MADWQEEPRVGHSVWAEHKNGVIDGIDYSTRTVYVDFYKKGRGSFEMDEFFGMWDDRLQQWVIVPI